MGIVVLPFFLMAIGAVLAIVDVATMGSSTSAMGRGTAANPRTPGVGRADELPPTYRSGTV